MNDLENSQFGRQIQNWQSQQVDNESQFLWQAISIIDTESDRMKNWK